MKELMIDIETLGTRPTSVILSIGACWFSDDGIGETFYVKVDADDCIDYGLTVDGSTIYWWLKQSDEARKEVMMDIVCLSEAYNMFKAFIGYENPLVWANSPSFDLAILKNAFEAVGSDATLWSYWNERDYRTVIRMAERDFGINRKLLEAKVKLNRRTSTKHCAVDDAVMQAEILIMARRMMKDGRQTKV